MKNFSIFFLFILGSGSDLFCTRTRSRSVAGSSNQALADYVELRRSPSPNFGSQLRGVSASGNISETPTQSSDRQALVPAFRDGGFTRDSDPNRCKRLCCFCSVAVVWYSAVAYLGWSEGYGDWKNIKRALTLLEPLMPGGRGPVSSHP